MHHNHGQPRSHKFLCPRIFLIQRLLRPLCLNTQGSRWRYNKALQRDRCYLTVFLWLTKPCRTACMKEGSRPDAAKNTGDSSHGSRLVPSADADVQSGVMVCWACRVRGIVLESQELQLWLKMTLGNEEPTTCCQSRKVLLVAFSTQTDKQCLNPFIWKQIKRVHP